MIKFIVILVIGYVIMKYVLRPLLMAFVVKSAGKVMQDMQKRQQGGTVNSAKTPDPVSPKKPAKEVPGEYIDYEEVK